MIVIGIDPGLSGAIAQHDTDTGEVIVQDMPTYPYSETGFVKRAVELHIVAAILRPFCGNGQVFMERVNAFPGQGTASMFSLGMSYWGVAGVVAALKLPLHLVMPKEWKGHFHLQGADKSLSRALAMRLYPEIVLAKVKDHGKAEALLIAKYGIFQLEELGML